MTQSKLSIIKWIILLQSHTYVWIKLSESNTDYDAINPHIFLENQFLRESASQTTSHLCLSPKVATPACIDFFPINLVCMYILFISGKNRFPSDEPGSGRMVNAMWWWQRGHRHTFIGMRGSELCSVTINEEHWSWVDCDGVWISPWISRWIRPSLKPFRDSNEG